MGEKVVQVILSFFGLSLALFIPVTKHDNLVSPFALNRENIVLDLPVTTTKTTVNQATSLVLNPISLTLDVSSKPDMDLKLNSTPSATPEQTVTPLPSASPISTEPTIKPTNTPLPTDKPKLIINSPSPEVKVSTPVVSFGLSADKIFSMVNAHRESLNLAAFQKDERACTLAEARAPEVGQEIAAGTMHKGMYGRNLPYWNTENIISMDSEEAAFNWWIHDYIHKVAIEGPYTYSCIACSGNNCAEEFTNFQPK